MKATTEDPEPESAAPRAPADAPSEATVAAAVLETVGAGDTLVTSVASQGAPAPATTAADEEVTT